MGGPGHGATPEDLLADTGWLRRLALRLAGDADVADDLVQETWMAAVRRPPEARDSLRPWLAKVLRDSFRMRARAEGRRAAREAASAALAGEVPTPDALVARAETQRVLVDLVLRLEEPYRAVVLLHYCEGMPLADIARAQGVPAATVRWRARAAIEKLRGWLDERPGGRKKWAVSFAALSKGVIVAQKTSKVAVAVVLLLLAGAGALFLARGRGDDDAARVRTGGGRGPVAAQSALGPGGAAPEARLPAWMAQRGLATRAIAGRVVDEAGAPVAGAAVKLSDVATALGAVERPRRVTGSDGAFDFGPQPALAYTVLASAPGHSSASLSIDLRAPGDGAVSVELRLGPCIVAVEGTVRDASGGAIAGASVASLRGQPDRLVPTGATETDAAGAYTLCVERGWVDLQVSADGYGAVVAGTSVWGLERIDVALVPEAIVVGRVVREGDRAPVPQALVWLEPGQWGLERSARRGALSDADGRFRIDGVAPGAHLASATAEGMATVTPRPITVEAGQTSDEIELALEARSTVRGVVRDGERPVAGAVVSAVTREPGRASEDAVSQADGAFVLERVPRGEVRFAVRPYQVVSPTSLRVDRPRHDGVVVEVDALGGITGVVLQAERPVAGARIDITGPNAEELSPVRTGPDGRFEARGLRPGTWTLYGSSESAGAFGRAPDVVLSGGETAEVTIDLAFGAAIAGTVVDQEGAPVAGVSVEFRHDRQHDIGLATTAADGSFRAAMMTGGGSYRVTVRPSERSPTTLRPAAGGTFPPVALADGASQVTGLVLAVRLDRLSLAGRVVDTEGAAVPDARVAAEMVEGDATPRFARWFQQASAITDVDGRFAIGDLPAGDYAVQARSAAGAETTLPRVTAGRRDLELVLPAPGALEGTLEGFRDTPRVLAMRRGAGAGATTQAVVTGAAFRQAPLSPGVYLVSAFTSDEAASREVTVAAGATARVALRSGGSAGVTARVIDFSSSAPVPGMRCVPWPRAGDAFTGSPAGEGELSNAAGVVQLTAVPAGELAIFCRQQGAIYTTGLRAVTLAPAQELTIDVPVVRIDPATGAPRGGLGADVDHDAVVTRLVRVGAGGAAATAGLRDGDVIVSVGGVSVTELAPMGVYYFIVNRAPGTRVAISARRGSRTIAAEVVLGPPEPD